MLVRQGSSVCRMIPGVEAREQHRHLMCERLGADIQTMEGDGNRDGPPIATLRRR
jgi:hypothetical protein